MADYKEEKEDALNEDGMAGWGSDSDSGLDEALGGKKSKKHTNDGDDDLDEGEKEGFDVDDETEDDEIV